ncbi:MAG: DUF89 family protein [Thermoplasmata archaeon]|nr:DUF89 family protein [Thermoplasmata archaeon]NIS11720.1 DUF89 family protein [Thermoplasmata archaeon]NIS19618.1 DUF89 family protein [Thermoplasmata archaeon]NIT76780.1 DUF89 family protein [Thermoplasmata archaeon]NIU48731.1 DUF89 family protein [Thermoplasmata archaeon]
MHPECVPCLLARVRFESELAAPERAMDALLAAAAEIGNSCPGDVSAEVATRAHRAAYEALGTRDPYAEQKRLSNEVALKLLPRARDMYESSAREDRLRVATLVSIVGNVLDFGISGGLEDPGKLEEAFDGLLAQGLGRDDTDEMAVLLVPGARIAYLADNCGEIVFDQVLIEELKGRGCQVDLVVKGDPILTDATREDVEALGLSEMVDRVLDTGPLAVGLDLTTVPEETKLSVEGADLVISKGMANLESLSDSDIRPIAYLLRTKCDPVAGTVGEAKDINVAKLFQ